MRDQGDVRRGSDSHVLTWAPVLDRPSRPCRSQVRTSRGRNKEAASSSSVSQEPKEILEGTTGPAGYIYTHGPGLPHREVAAQKPIRSVLARSAGIEAVVTDTVSAPGLLEHETSSNKTSKRLHGRRSNAGQKYLARALRGCATQTEGRRIPCASYPCPSEIVLSRAMNAANHLRGGGPRPAQRGYVRSPAGGCPAPLDRTRVGAERGDGRARCSPSSLSRTVAITLSRAAARAAQMHPVHQLRCSAQDIPSPLFLLRSRLDCNFLQFELQ